jgi:DNA-binding CsgD family transcriptional regulator
VEEGLRLLDEAMVAVTSGEVAPIPSGIVYCGVIIGCQDAYDPGRAREWTAALTRWCEHQPDMVAFTGTCLVHRAEILQLEGAWSQALDAARDAAARCSAGGNARAAAEAAYRRGEIHRLRGEHDAAAEAFREAGVAGCEPQPGLALLRLADGDGRAAAAALDRVLGEATEWPRRVQLLPAHVEVMLGVGEGERASASARELGTIADGHASELVAALAGQATGAVALAGGDPAAALPSLRRAWRTWVDVGAPYEAARVRLLTGLACRELGDEETAALELEAARAVFDRLGATPDRARAESLLGLTVGAHGLTARELEVLRRVAAGATNKAIAAELVLSDRTVDRHVSNIFTKLRVTSRAAATAYAYEHGLV